MSLTHIFQQFIHTFPLVNKGFEQGFLTLSTVMAAGYYYYLYIDQTRSPANPTALNQIFKVSTFVNVMKDFQLKKMRATT